MANARNLSTLAQGASTAGILAGTYGGTGANLTPTTAGNVIFTADGSVWSSTQKIVRGTPYSSPAGPNMDFPNIPAWAKRITILFQGVSTTGTSNLQIQLGTGATPTYATSGYIGARADIFNAASPTVAAYSSAFVLGNGFATTYLLHGSAVIYNISGNLWVESHGISRSDTAMSGTGAGSITLGAALTAVRINTSNGTDTLDAGSVNILYE